MTRFGGTLPKTNHLPLKRDLPKKKINSSNPQPPLFRGKVLVLGNVPKVGISHLQWFHLQGWDDVFITAWRLLIVSESYHWGPQLWFLELIWRKRGKRGFRCSSFFDM